MPSSKTGHGSVLNPYKELPCALRGSSNNTRFRASYWIILILMATLYTFLCRITPFCLDDWTFMSSWRDDARGGYDFSFSTWQRYYDFTRSYDNGRISNALSPFSTMFSPWRQLFPLFTGVLLAFCGAMLQRYSCGRQSAFYMALTWLMMILFLPWRDTLFARDYALNYIWAAAVTIIFIYTLLKKSPYSLLWAVIAGGWHESFAIATLCGLFLLVLLRRFRFPAIFYAAVLLYLATTLLFMLSPGMIGRITNSVQGGFVRGSYLNYLILGLDVVLIAICAISERGRAILGSLIKTDNLAVVALGIIISGYAIAVLTVHTDRSFFWPQFAAIFIALSIVSKVWKEIRMYPIVTWGLAAICITQTVSVIYWQSKYTAENDRIIELLDHSESGSVFFDSELPLHPPAYTLRIPISNLWRNPYHYRALWSYYETPVIGVVPTDLKHASPSSFERDTARFKIPRLKEMGALIPFITEEGDTLLYVVPSWL